jgi:hypothetical protein
LEVSGVVNAGVYDTRSCFAGKLPLLQSGRVWTRLESLYDGCPQQETAPKDGFFAG